MKPRTCAICGEPLKPKRWKSGELERITHFMRRKTCSIRCKSELIRQKYARWTPDRVDQLRTLLEQGMSARQAARIMSTSKNAVIGAAYRNDLIFKSRARLVAKHEDLVRQAERDRAVARAAEEALRKQVYLASLDGDKQCCHQDKDGKRDCANPKQPGRVLCSVHIRAAIPKHERGWSGLSNASGRSSLW